MLWAPNAHSRLLQVTEEHKNPKCALGMGLPSGWDARGVSPCFQPGGPEALQWPCGVLDRGLWSQGRGCPRLKAPVFAEGDPADTERQPPYADHQHNLHPGPRLFLASILPMQATGANVTARGPGILGAQKATKALGEVTNLTVRPHPWPHLPRHFE